MDDLLQKYNDYMYYKEAIQEYDNEFVKKKYEGQNK